LIFTGRHLITQYSQTCVIGLLGSGSCFQSLCMRFPSVAGADLRALAGRRRLTARVGLGRSRAAGRRGSPVRRGHVPRVPGERCTPPPRVANRVGEEDSAGAGALVVRRPGRVTGNTVTIRDSKRFAEPLALPRSCPPYVRDQWINRTHDRTSWWPAPSDRTCFRYRSGGTFSQVSTA
jgi:hypothetical protein